MFEVMLIVCYIDGSCLRFADRLGPYEDETECTIRLEEITEMVPLVSPLPWRIMKAECSEPDTGEISV